MFATLVSVIFVTVRRVSRKLSDALRRNWERKKVEPTGAVSSSHKKREGKIRVQLCKYVMTWYYKNYAVWYGRTAGFALRYWVQNHAQSQCTAVAV